MRKLFKHIGMICLALAVAIGSFFVPIRKPNQSQMASADDSIQVNTFTSSNVLSPTYCGYYGSNVECAFYLLNLKFSITNISSTDFSITFDSHISYISASATPTYNSYAIYSARNNNNSSTISISSNDPLDTSIIPTPDTRYSQKTLYTYGKSGWGYTWAFNYLIEESFNCNVLAVRLYSISDNGRYYNVLEYSDSNSKKFTIFISVPSSLNGYDFSSSIVDYLFTDRTYFTNLNFDDNQLYQQGYNQGLLDNQQPIYNNGYNAGFDDGFSDGKTEGIVEANDYSFIGLFGALFDAPVTMLMGLLNFEFLGIDLWAFVTSLFTLALVLFIVKLIMGR